MGRKRKEGSEQPRQLTDGEYDATGMPTGKISLTWRTYNLMAGRQSCWVAEIEELPGYYGEGATIDDALMRLRQDLGPRPHFRVDHKFRPATKLEEDIVRKHKALAGAALTDAAGGGGALDVTAKQLGIGKRALNQARKNLAEAKVSPDDRPVAGVSQEAIDRIARYERIGGKREVVGCAPQASQLEVWVAREAPWRVEHAEARSRFPAGNHG